MAFVPASLRHRDGALNRVRAPLAHLRMFLGLFSSDSGLQAVRARRGVNKPRLLGLLLLSLWTTVSAASPPSLFLELDIAIERGGTTGLLFDFGDGIWGDGAVVAEVPPGVVPSTVRLPLPTRPIRSLRFDPTADDQAVLITGMRLVTGAGESLLAIDPKGLRPMHQIQAIVADGEGVRVTPIPQADDPMLRLDIAPVQKRMHDAMQRVTVGRGTVVALALASATMIIFAIFTAWRAHGTHGARGGLIGGAAIALTVFGLRLLWLNLYGRPVPFWDEWEGDVLYILIPFVGEFLDWQALIMPQWEHRILLTRIITLFGTVLNGEWDPRVAMTVSAAMFAGMIALIGTILISTRRLIGAIAAVALAVSAALPYDFNNIFWGGQTQMYGLLLMAVVVIAMASATRVTPAIYIGAAGASLVSLFTMGAGPLGPACAVGICLVRCAFERDQRRALVRLGVIFFAAALLGVFLHVSSRAHVPLYANSWAQFQRAFMGILAWPLPPRAIWAALLWVPWFVNGVLILRRREASPLEWLAVGLGTWGMINAVALGYARQYEGPPFDSRFFTALSLGAMGAFCSSIALVLRAPLSGWSRYQAGHVAWVAMILGMIGVGIDGLAGAKTAGATRAELDHRIRVFLSTGNSAPLLEKPPHHTGPEVIARLESSILHTILPAPYRRALAARFGPEAGSEAEAGWLTLTVRTLMKAGPGIAALGLMGCGYIMWRTRASQPRRLRRAVDWRITVSDRGCYILTAVLVVGWGLIYHYMLAGGLVDEPGHVAAIQHFSNQSPGWPESMPMLPGYHFMVMSVGKLWPTLSLLAVARLVTVLTTLLGLGAFALIWKKLHGQPAGRATLLFALLPLTQPFTGMAYSDMAALAFALVAFWAQLSGRGALAALILVGAIGIRQTNLIWVGFLIAWEFFRSDVPRQTLLQRVRWLLLLSTVALVIIIAAGRLTLGVQHGNSFAFNPASVHFAAVLLLVLGMPIWWLHLPAWFAESRAAAQARPMRVMGWAVLGVVAVGALTLSYRNPHLWNREVFWEGCSFTLLRNWPLIWADLNPVVRVASSLNVVLMAFALVRYLASQADRAPLFLALAVGSVPVLTNSLVEPRYMIPAAGFLLCFIKMSAIEWRYLVGWWAVLTVIHAPFVALGLSLW